MKERYIPIIKTTDAELKGYAELATTIRSVLLPLFELTKSRKTKYEPYGNIEKKMDKLTDIVGDGRFILDLTSHEDMMNHQIEGLLDSTDGFANWRAFLGKYRDYQIVPVIHVDPDDLEQTGDLVNWLDDNYDQIALRVSCDDEYLPEYLDVIRRNCTSDQKLLIILDAEYVDEDSFNVKRNACSERVREIIAESDQIVITVASSSFPKSVVGHTKDCKDSEGEFPKLEEQLSQAVSFDTRIDLVYGDYASIHPVRLQVSGGTWVPRVDFPTENTFIYSRFRRNDGGYAKAAQYLVRNAKYHFLECWGGREIQSASEGVVNGKSPSFWIAVRLNLHITREASRLAR